MRKNAPGSVNLPQNLNAMSRLDEFLYAPREEHVHFYCDGITLYTDGLCEEAVPARLKEALCNIFCLLESRLPTLESICVSGVFFLGNEPGFCAVDIWLQTEEEGFYLPMLSAASLFSDNGIPYYHQALSL